MNVEQIKKKILDTLSAEKQKLPLSIHFLKLSYSDFKNNPNEFHLVSKTQMTECYQPLSFYKPITMLLDLSSNEQNSL
jgi:hypothetical protein